MAQAPKYDIDEILRLRRSGMTLTAVAETVGCSSALVGKVCKRAGIRMNVSPWDSGARERKPKPERPKTEPKPKRLKMPQLSPTQIERGLEAELTSRCAGCRAWSMTGTARDVLQAFQEHQASCFARRAAA